MTTHRVANYRMIMFRTIALALALACLLVGVGIAIGSTSTPKRPTYTQVFNDCLANNTYDICVDYAADSVTYGVASYHYDAKTGIGH